MIEFDWWLCVSIAILLFVNGVVGFIGDIHHKRNLALWVLHFLSIILGVVFVIWTV